MKDLLIFLADGFEEIEAFTIADYLRRADIEVDLVSIYQRKNIKSAHNIEIIADYTLDEIKVDEYRALYIPGGLPGATNLASSNKILELVKMYEEEDKLVAAICAGPIVLDKAELLQEGKFTCYPGFEKNLTIQERVDEAVVIDGNIVTSMGPSFAQILAFKLIELLKDKKSAEKVKLETLFTKLEEFIKDGKLK